MMIDPRHEIEYIWRRNKSRSSYYFLLNRYFSFFGNIAVSILGFTDLPVQVSVIIMSAVLWPNYF
jgi:hypothetical protein